MDTPETPAQPAGNFTRANVTGKVPEFAKPHGGRNRGSVKARPQQRKHFRKLKKRGLISDRAGAQNGL